MADDRTVLTVLVVVALCVLAALWVRRRNKSKSDNQKLHVPVDLSNHENTYPPSRIAMDGPARLNHKIHHDLHVHTYDGNPNLYSGWAAWQPYHYGVEHYPIAPATLACDPRSTFRNEYGCKMAMMGEGGLLV